ncbi:MAG: hypothetical protein RM049_25855 [Nostoc sp. DedQUE04]|nr:hypothetical protein [Nostoc sp. DedQUE04]MDZ8138688.1 hypothetical protein [Nostoc sp. DedQUE04]
MPKTSDMLQETYYYNQVGQLVKEVFNQSGKKVDVRILKTNLFNKI